MGPAGNDTVAELDLLRFAAAGSVDDGKSTLIGRLLYDSKSIFEDQLSALDRTSRKRGQDKMDLSLLTDGLLAEREQGITIDVAYRYFATPRRKFIIADTPGHEQYTRNMVTGASTADLAIILIDARKGVLTQSRRHAYLSHLLGVPHLVVAVNKMDLVDYSQSRFDQIQTEFTKFAQGLGVRDIRYVPISALLGDMVVDRGTRMAWYQGPTLLEMLETAEVGGDVGHDALRFPVQLVARPDTAAGRERRGYLGRIESGTVRAGDAVTVWPSGVSSRVSRIVTFDGDLGEARAPQSVTLELEHEIDVSRGDMIVHTNPRAVGELAPSVSQMMEAEVCWLHARPLERRHHYLIKHTTRTVKAAFDDIGYVVDINTLEPVSGAKTLAMNDIAHVKLRLHQPLVCDSYVTNRATGAFIVIDPANNATVAAGMIAALPTEPWE
jgi:sulfate adenylyltransferase subunit 1